MLTTRLNKIIYCWKVEHEEQKEQEEEEARKQEDTEHSKDDKQQELDPLLAKKATNGLVKTEYIQTGSEIALKALNQDPSSSVEPVSGEKAASLSPGGHPELQQQISNKSNRSTGTGNAANSNDTPVSKDLSFFLQQQKDASQRALISPQIRFVMFQFLFTTVRPFTSEFLTKNVLELIFKKAVFKESKRIDHKQPPEYLYRYGRGCHYFILILSGEATIEVGKERLEFPAGPFSYFGENALLCGRNTVDQVINEDLSGYHPPAQTVNSSTEETASTSVANTPNAAQPLQIPSLHIPLHSKLYVPDFSLRVDDR